MACSHSPDAHWTPSGVRSSSRNLIALFAGFWGAPRPDGSLCSTALSGFSWIVVVRMRSVGLLRGVRVVLARWCSVRCLWSSRASFPWFAYSNVTRPQSLALEQSCS
jgi:hypothetical protein